VDLKVERESHFNTAGGMVSFAYTRFDTLEMKYYIGETMALSHPIAFIIHEQLVQLHLSGLSSVRLK